MLIIALGLAALSLSEPPSAAAEPETTITVNGRRDPKQEVDEFVRSLVPSGPRSHVNRFEQSVCPIALGLPPAQAAALARRMTLIAKQGGLTVGGTGCSPNVYVMVTRDKNLLLAELRRRYPEAFGSLSTFAIRRLSHQPGPAVVWHSEGPPISARGTELFFDEQKGYYVNQSTEQPSRISAGGRRQFSSAVVVVERAALEGLTVTQLADYAAMRAYTAADPAKLTTTTAPSILRVLEAPENSLVPLSVTNWDLGYLRGFYGGNRNLGVNAQRSQIGEAVAKQVTGQ